MVTQHTIRLVKSEKLQVMIAGAAGRVGCALLNVLSYTSNLAFHLLIHMAQ